MRSVILTMGDPDYPGLDEFYGSGRAVVEFRGVLGLGLGLGVQRE